MSVISLNPLFASSQDAALLSDLSDLNGSLLLTLLGAMDDGVLLVALDGTISYANAPAIGLYGFEDFAAIEGKPWASLWPSTDQDRITALIEDGGRGISAKFESHVLLPTGRTCWLRLTFDPVPGPRKEPAILLVTLRETTDLRLADGRLAAKTAEMEAVIARKEALLQQKGLLSLKVDHRVKNSLSLLNTMLCTQAQSLCDPACEAALLEAAGRITTIAEIHGQMTIAEDVSSVAIAPFLSSIMTKVATAHPGLVALEEGSIAEIDLSPQQATAVGLIATELLTHALTSRAEGEEVTVAYSFTVETGACLLSVTDSCTELPESFSFEMADSLSFRICRTHATQLDGALTHSPGTPRGTTFNLAFPP